MNKRATKSELGFRRRTVDDSAVGVPRGWGRAARHRDGAPDSAFDLVLEKVVRSGRPVEAAENVQGAPEDDRDVPIAGCGELPDWRDQPPLSSTETEFVQVVHPVAAVVPSERNDHVRRPHGLK